MTVTAATPDRLTPGNAGIAQLPPPSYFHIQLTKHGFTFSRALVVIVLLVSSALKLHGLQSGHLKKEQPIPVLVEWAVVVWEISLALWVVSSVQIEAARLAAIGTFIVFGYSSMRFALSGQSSCCCFGQLEVQPWLVFILDVTIIVILIMNPPREFGSLVAPSRRQVVWYGCFAVGLVGSISLAANFGRSEPTLQVFEEPFQNTPVVIVAGTRMEWVFRIQNLSSQTVRIGAISTTCECLTLKLETDKVLPGQIVACQAILDLSIKPDFYGDLQLNASAPQVAKNALAFSIQRSVTVAQKSVLENRAK